MQHKSNTYKLNSYKTLSRLIAMIAFCALAATSPSFADGIVTSAAGTGSFGNDYAAMSGNNMSGINQFHTGGLQFTSLEGLPVTLSQPGTGFLGIVGSNSFGFPADEELYNNQQGGLVTYVFGQDIYGLGMWVASATGGHHTTYFDLYKRDGTHLAQLPFFNGTNGTSIYATFADTQAEIATVVVSDYGGAAANYLYLGNLGLSTPAPEPGTTAVAAAALFALGCRSRLRRRHESGQTERV